MRWAAVIPAYQAERTIGAVVGGLAHHEQLSVVVVDDGSLDRTSEIAKSGGALVVRHAKNRGKGAALRSGLARAHELGAEVAVTLDADGQHPPAEALRLLADPAPSHALVLGIRNLVAAGAPRANRFSNAFSNFFLELFSGLTLGDTQCGLRRYPVVPTLKLGVRENGYGFEAEVILRAARARWTIAQVPVRVIYPPAGERITHFRNVRDPARIVVRVLHTFATAPRPR